MSRFKHLLTTPAVSSITGSKIIGVFPFNALIDPTNTDVHAGRIDFLESSIEGLKLIGKKNISVILMINQFRQRQVSMDNFQMLNQTVERFISSQGVTVAGLYWCPSIVKFDPYVVPNAGMFNRATENQQIKWDNIPVVSTSDNDLIAASKVNAQAIKIGSGSNKWTHFNTFYEWVNQL